MAEGNVSEPILVRNDPFDRPKSDGDCRQEADKKCRSLLERLENPVEDSLSTDDLFRVAMKVFHSEWKSRKKNSEIALKGLLVILEVCLSQPSIHDTVFADLIETLGYNTVTFWKSAIPNVYNSDLSYATQYRETLLFSLVLYDANNSKNRLRELYAAVPGVRQSMLGTHAKLFGERYRHIQMVRSRANSRMSSVQGSVEDLLALDNDVVDDKSDSNSHVPTMPSAWCDLAHQKQRVINVSNAPPVSISRKTSGSWEIKQGSGGLVACVDPVMSVDRENIWLSNLGINWDENVEDIPTSTNSLGLPLLKQARAGEVFHVLEENDKKAVLTKEQQVVENDMSLVNVFHGHNKETYQLNPIILNSDDYDTYYGGISNGLLWPALHNLPQHIVTEYDDQHILREHWCSYVRVNYQFAINAVRNSRPQDFIWIHDYHLMLCGQIMRSLESKIEVGFFLHIPFQPPENFLTKYKTVADPIIRALLRFTKVGFQTSRDRETYVKLVRENIPRARIQYESPIDVYTIAHDGWTCSLGVFPVSIKIEDFSSIANAASTKIEAETIKGAIMKHSGPSGRLFFSVERFDYTKGIKEKLQSWQKFFEKHPERIGQDVLYQVAVINRRGVETYKNYQDACVDLAEEINRTIKSEKYPEWKPLIFNTEGLPRDKLVAHYLAMDVGVVTPSKDGMNLVAKEMLVCNPTSSLVLSTGAGTEVQLGNAGLYSDTNGHCYHRVEDIHNIDEFAETFYRAATESSESREVNGSKLNKFLREHDIEEWSTAFLDPSWTHEVISKSEVTQLADFYILMAKTAHIRRQIVEHVLKGLPIKQHFTLSLENAKEALENSCEEGTNKLVLATTASADDIDENNLTAKFDISDELGELNKDIAFLSFIQSDEITNVEQFIDTLGSFHPSGPTVFATEVENAVQLLTQGEHFHYFFTDRDGTLKSYACSYPTSIQPAYSAVIQAQFARRCAQFCAIVTTAPLVHIGILNVSTIPEGYYAYGASAGREWYFNPAMQFKDDSVSESDLRHLHKVFDMVEDLLENPEYRNFTWIGSGLQRHYGHITIAKQDVNNSVPKRKMTKLYEQIIRIVNEVDPTGTILTIRESDLDIKIYTKAKLSGRIFSKEYGIRLVERKMGINLRDGNVLVCGDSNSDIPMLEECLSVAASKVFTIWVTEDESLKQTVTNICAKYSNTNVRFVSSPQVLLGAMAAATVKELKRGSTLDLSFQLDDDK